MVLLIDNYDSFVYNLARYVGELGYVREVYRNNKITIEEIKKLNPTHIIISPGPCAPNEAGISMEVIKCFSGLKPILGVCLGHQAIGQVFGGVVKKAKKPMHGKDSIIKHNSSCLFTGVENPVKVARYHSLIVEHNNFPTCLNIDAESEEGEIMAISHKFWPTYGLQFHPESVLTKCGYALLKNFLAINNRTFHHCVADQHNYNEKF